MTKTIKKVGIPTTLLRGATINEEGLKVISAKLEGVDIELVQDNQYRFIFHSISTSQKTGCNIHYRNEVIFTSNGLYDNIIDLWIDNKTAVRRIKDGSVDSVEIDNYTVDLLTGVVESKYEYMFISNENDFTLE